MKDMSDLGGLLALAIFAIIGAATVVGWLIDLAEVTVRKRLKLSPKSGG